MFFKRTNFIDHSIQGVLSFLKESLFADTTAIHNGFLQARDPRFKTAMFLFLMGAVLFTRSIAFLGGMYFFCLGLALVSAIPLGFFLKRTWIFIPLFSLCIALPAMFSMVTPGEPILAARIWGGSLIVTKQGLASAGFFFMRVLTSVSLAVLLVLTTRHTCLLKVLRIFKVPPVFVMTLGMCYRYIYLFIETVQQMYAAIKSRVGFIRSVRKGQGVVAWNIVNLWQRSYYLHTQVYDAMLSRGFTGEPQVMDDFRVTYRDWFLLGTAVLIFGLSLWQNYYLI